MFILDGNDGNGGSRGRVGFLFRGTVLRFLASQTLFGFVFLIVIVFNNKALLDWRSGHGRRKKGEKGETWETRRIGCWRTWWIVFIPADLLALAARSSPDSPEKSGGHQPNARQGKEDEDEADNLDNPDQMIESPLDPKSNLLPLHLLAMLLLVINPIFSPARQFQ